jgi:hypothetical protein
MKQDCRKIEFLTLEDLKAQADQLQVNSNELLQAIYCKKELLYGLNPVEDTVGVGMNGLIASISDKILQAETVVCCAKEFIASL